LFNIVGVALVVTTS